MPYHASMFARRASWDLSQNDLSRRLDARRAAGLPILDLTESNPTRCHFSFPARLLGDALERLRCDSRTEHYLPVAIAGERVGSVVLVKIAGENGVRLTT